MIPVIEALRRESAAFISVDTSKPEVMRAAVAAGADIINDVRALAEPGALEAAAMSGAGVCLMHMQGEPRTMQDAPRYEDVVAEVSAFLASRIRACRDAGIARDAPGCRSWIRLRQNALAHNLTLLKHLRALGRWACRSLVGLSRKSMLGKLTGRRSDERLAGSVALAAIAVLNGARIVRAHDVAATVDAVARGSRCQRMEENSSMARKYFGTDGVRGRVGEHPMTVDFALRLASAAARVLAPNGGTVLIGKDTRLSGYMFEAALEAGFVAAGVNVLLIGPLPTPGIAYLTRKFGCDFGVVISASHNLYDDNGIKFFDGKAGSSPTKSRKRSKPSSSSGAITRSSHGSAARSASTSRAVSTRTSAPKRCPRASTLDGTEARGRLRQRRRLQGRSAHAGRPRRRGHSDRLFAQRPQHQ